MGNKIDILRIVELCKKIKESNKDETYEKKFSELNRQLNLEYGVELPQQVMWCSRDKYHDVTNSPYIFVRIANMLIKKAVKTSDIVEIENPLALYNLCAGLNANKKVFVRGDVGSFFGSTSNGVDSHITGNTGRSLYANVTSGRCVVDGVADEGAGYCNQGADILLKGNTRPRTGVQMRKGNIITLECLVFNSGLYMAGGNILCLGSKVGKQLGPGMVAGNIYVPYANEENLGIGTVSRELDEKDIENIKKMLGIFPEHLETEKTSDCRFLINGKEYDFSRFRKIIAKRDSNSTALTS